MKKCIMIALASLAVIAMYAQEKNDIRREIEVLERSAESVLDTITVFRFDESYIGDELWINEFSEYYNNAGKGRGVRSEWAQIIVWLIPEGIADSKYVLEEKDDSFVIDFFGRTDITFSLLVQRLKAHGFTSEANDECIMGVHLYEARNAAGDRKCAVTDFGENHLQVAVEESMTDEEVMRSLLKRTGVSGENADKMIEIIRSQQEK